MDQYEDAELRGSDRSQDSVGELSLLPGDAAISIREPNYTPRFSHPREGFRTQREARAARRFRRRSRDIARQWRTPPVARENLSWRGPLTSRAAVAKHVKIIFLKGISFSKILPVPRTSPGRDSSIHQRGAGGVGKEGVRVRSTREGETCAGGLRSWFPLPAGPPARSADSFQADHGDGEGRCHREPGGLYSLTAAAGQSRLPETDPTQESDGASVVASA